MFKRIVAGIDEETHGRDAIALAGKLASGDSEFTFAHVRVSLMPARQFYAGPVEQIEDTRRLLAEVAAESHVDAVTRWVNAPSVGAGLHAVADQIGADLLVVGATGRSRLARTLIGNPTTQTLAGCGCVVAVAPEGYADTRHPLRRIGVAYDGSHASRAAIALARRLARETGAELSAFEVVPAFQEVLPVRRHRLERAVTALKAARDGILTHEGVEPHVACGDPIGQLSGYSRTIDILVAGSRGAGSLARLLHPSTTAALTDVVSCPMLVLTKGARLRLAAMTGATMAAHDTFADAPGA